MKAVFLDRDGVIIEDVGHITNPKDVKLINKVSEAIRNLNERFKVFIVSNQSAVGRGLCNEDDAWKVNDRVLKLLEAKIDKSYLCFHHPVHGIGKYKVDCVCRKPKPGMLLQAAEEFGINLLESYLVGDNLTDIEAGKAAGCKTILVRTGHGNDYNNTNANDLYEAVKLIMEEK